MTVACIIIASVKRQTLVRERVLPSVLAQPFDEIVVVADYAADLPLNGFRWLVVEPMTATTTDALVKRDAGTLATTSDILVYLCDDHALHPEFLGSLRQVLAELWDVLVPSRCCLYTDGSLIMLNSGFEHGYCGGHAGVFRRHVIQRLPWSAGPHDRCWDTNMSLRQQELGFVFAAFPALPILVQDLEPENRPWQ